MREVEYGATRRGFEPAGNDINAAPPTLNNNYEKLKPLAPNEEDDGQYREDPSIYYKNDPYARVNNPPANADYRPSYQQNSYQQPAYQPQPEPEYRPSRPSYKPPSFDSFQEPAYQQPSYRQPSYQQQSYQQPSYQQPAYREPSYQEPAYQQPAYRPVTRFGFDSASNNNNQYGGSRHPSTNVDYFSGSYSVSYR